MKSKGGRFTAISIRPLMALAVLALGLGISATAWARVARNALVLGPDPTAVTACGTLSGNSVIYQVKNNIATSSTGNCIVLSGNNSALDLHGFTITGPGLLSLGSGILVTGANDVVEGFNGFVTGFLVGVTDSGSNNNGDDINMTANGTGLVMSGTTSKWANLSVDSSTSNGILLNGCADECLVTDAFVHDNGGHGILVKSRSGGDGSTGSDGATVDVFVSNDNGGDGVHVGCLAGVCGPSNAVSVLDGFAGPAFGSGDPNSGRGVVIDSSEASSKEVISTVTATGNTIDLFDASSGCGTGNLWFDNTAGSSQAGLTPNPTCIPIAP
jgi:hypothetical protein